MRMTSVFKQTKQQWWHPTPAGALRYVCDVYSPAFHSPNFHLARDAGKLESPKNGLVASIASFSQFAVSILFTPCLTQLSPSMDAPSRNNQDSPSRSSISGKAVAFRSEKNMLFRVSTLLWTNFCFLLWKRKRWTF
jgi:hypothetical protein